MAYQNLIEQAQALAVKAAIVKKLSADLALNIKRAKGVLTAAQIADIKAIYSQNDMMETSRALDEAIDAALAGKAG